ADAEQAIGTSPELIEALRLCADVMEDCGSIAGKKILKERVRRWTDQSAQDLAALQGTWAQVGFEENGVANAPDSYEGAMGALTTIKGNHFSVRAQDGRLLLEGTFSLD